MTDPAHLFRSLARAALPTERPLVILAWAQTLDGSVAWPDGSPLSISSEASFRFTHRLRAFCDGILVGIGAVLADDPQLTVRDVVGEPPQPIVLDTKLRFPPAARLLDHPRQPWLLTGPLLDDDHRRQLANRALILPQPVDEGGRVDLAAALSALRARGIHTLMVEGGPTVHAAFLRAHLADWIAITMGPQLLGGLPALHLTTRPPDPIPILKNLQIARLDPDLLVWGEVKGES